MDVLTTQESRIYSIGHGNRTWEAFISLLQCFGIEHLADIRSYPASRRNPHFNQESLRASLAQAGVSYAWFPDLGGLRRKGLGRRSPHFALTSPAFRNYADHMGSAAFAEAVRNLLVVAGMARTCFMCAETAPQRCHRLLLADYLSIQGIQVIHILDLERTTLHSLSPHAAVREGSLVYDSPPSRQLDLDLP
jgi:uncharacterized protein (DUF488 family)